MTLRLDLPRYADRPPAAWSEVGCDRVEVQVHYVLKEEDLRLRGLPDGAPVDVEHRVLPGGGGLRVAVRGEGVEAEFTAYDSLRVGHISAYRSADGDPYTARRRFVSRVDQHLHTTLPPTIVKPFYDSP
ncbi:hypothetical protein ACWGB8_11865 [Kitasatospora sp. NPDC054939]